MTDLVSWAAVQAAARRLQGIAVHTPLLPAPDLSAEVGSEVRLKCETLQRSGSFKIRGAYNCISQLDPAVRQRGVVAYSSGNHGQGVALVARLLGIRSVVVMPTTALLTKQEGARQLRAEVILHGTTSLERRERAEAIAKERGMTVIPGFDHPHILAGQGTVGLEIAADWPEVEIVLIPVGGGGLAGGSAVALKHEVPNVQVVGVEPCGAPSMHTALRAGKPVTLSHISTIADGLSATRVSDLTLAHARRWFDDVVLVEDDAIREAAAFLLTRQKLVVEFSGAAAVAALRKGLVSARGRRVAVVLSGGNIDAHQVQSLLPSVAVHRSP